VLDSMGLFFFFVLWFCLVGFVGLVFGVVFVVAVFVFFWFCSGICKEIGLVLCLFFCCRLVCLVLGGCV